MGGNIETFICKTLKPYIYAAIEDERKKNDSDDPYPVTEYANYTSVTTVYKKGTAKPKLKDIVKIGSNAKEAFAIIFDKFMTELSDTSINNNDTLATIGEKLYEADCMFGKFMLDFTAMFKNTMGENLKKVSDEGSFLIAHVGQTLHDKNNEKVAIANIAAIFEDFMKTYCMLVARRAWYQTGIILTAIYMVADLSMIGMNQFMCDYVRDNIKKKDPVAKTSRLLPAVVPPVPKEEPVVVNSEAASQGAVEFLNGIDI